MNAGEGRDGTGPCHNRCSMDFTHRLTIAAAALLLSSSPVDAQTRAKGPNRPPHGVDGISDEETVDSDGYLVLDIRAEDPDEEPLTYRIEELPPKARVEWDQAQLLRYDGAELMVHHPQIVWDPEGEYSGTYDIRVTATDGQVTITKTIHVTVQEEWETFLMPGVSYTMYQPVGAELGTMHGPAAEFLLAGWIHRNENRGPSHVRLYASIGLLSSTESDVSKAVQPAFGFDLSIERNPRRSFLIPYFGIEGGLIAQDALGAPGYVLPFVGGHLWSSQNLFVNVSGGYVFPMRSVDLARGYSGTLSMNFSLW